MTKLFIGGLPYSLTNEKLEELFAKYGAVSSCQIVMDKYTNTSKGFAFVEMSDDSQAQSAIKELDGYGLDGRKIGVSVARPREESSNNRNYSSGNSRGGFGGGRDNRDNSQRRGSGGNSFLRGSHRR